MGKRDLPDIYALARGPQAQGRGHIYIRQIPIAHVITNISTPVSGQIKVKNWVYVIVITQDEYDILVITRVRGKAEDEC